MTKGNTEITQEQVGFNARNLPLPVFVASLVTILSLVAGLLVGPGANSFIGETLVYSSNSSGFVGNIGSFLPLGFAFAAGMVATVNPCGFVMLPAFLTVYMSDQQGDSSNQRNAIEISRSLIKALYVSSALGTGFIVLFGGVGLIISSPAKSLVGIFPWVGFALGFVMAGLGAYLFAGGRLYNNKAQSAAALIGTANETSVKGYFLFGVSYALASLSCTLPIFLGLISSSLVTGGIIEATGQFIAYAMGMSFVITVLTMGIAVFKGTVVGQLRKIMPYVHPISAGVSILVGGYLIFYWLTEGEISRHFNIG